jgi:hypothetical protein
MTRSDFLEFEAGGRSLDEMTAEANATIAAYTGAVERILGAAPGSILLADPDTFRAWLGPEDAASE